MKNKLYRTILFILFMLYAAFLNVSFAQGPEPPPSSPSQGGSGHDLGGNQGKGGDAPLDEGVGVSLFLAVVYGGHILNKIRKGCQKIEADSREKVKFLQFYKKCDL